MSNFFEEVSNNANKVEEQLLGPRLSILEKN